MALVVNSAVLESKLSVRFTHGTVAGLTNEQDTIDDFNEVVQMDSGSTPGVSLCFAIAKVMTGGTDTIDLYDGLTDPEGTALANNTKHVRAIKFKAPTTNAAGGIIVTFGATNAYLLLGAAWKFILLPGQSVLVYCASGSPAISSSLTNIDVTGTTSDVLDVVAVFG